MGEGHTVCVENILRESNHDGVEVFNFKVEDYHTYYVGESCILVHNANYVINKSGNIEITDWEGYPEDMPKTRRRNETN
mgnify:CR=1 FL=1